MSKHDAGTRALTAALDSAGFEVAGSRHEGGISLLDVRAKGTVEVTWLVVVHWGEAGAFHAFEVAYVGNPSTRYNDNIHRRIRTAVGVWAATVRAMSRGAT